MVKWSEYPKNKQKWEKDKSKEGVVETEKIKNGWTKLSSSGQYSRKAWIDLRNSFRAKNPLCKMCLEEGKVKAGTEVDHILDAETHPDLFYEWDNLQNLCNYHHRWKTRRDQLIRQGKDIRHLNQSVMDDLES